MLNISYPALKVFAFSQAHRYNRYTACYIVTYFQHYVIYTDMHTEENKMSDEKQRMLSVRVTRLNISELYQYLSAESILQQMVDRQLILPANKEDALAYTHKYAKNSIATKALFLMDNPPTFLLNLCDVLKSTGSSQQLNLATKLRSGIFTRFLDSILSLANVLFIPWFQTIKDITCHIERHPNRDSLVVHLLL